MSWCFITATKEQTRTDTNHGSSNEEVVLLHRAAKPTTLPQATALNNRTYSKTTHFSLEITWKHTLKNNLGPAHGAQACYPNFWDSETGNPCCGTILFYTMNMYYSHWVMKSWQGVAGQEVRLESQTANDEKKEGRVRRGQLLLSKQQVKKMR